MSNEELGRRESKIVDTLVRAMRAPDPDNWQEFYTPDDADEYAAELADIESELDAGWPGWREKRPWTNVGPEKSAWIKKRLKRRDLILHGRGAWGVNIVWKGRTGDKPGKPFAVPIMPRRERDAVRFGPVFSVSMLCRRLGVSPAQAREALRVMPDGERSVYSWVRRRVATSQGSDAPPKQSPPAPTRKHLRQFLGQNAREIIAALQAGEFSQDIEELLKLEHRQRGRQTVLRALLEAGAAQGGAQ